jgi:medium-chain acyl-[acyl-carrier-protein] hydrolase
MTLTSAHVWLVDVDDERSVARATAVLPPTETARLSAVITPGRHRRLGAQAALRILAAEAAGVSPARLRVRRDPNGKPFLAHALAPHISLSHSGAFAAVAIATAGLVGVDIEEQRPIGHLDGLARTTMSDAEYAWWLTLDGAAAAESLFRRWTYKEAVLKALGVGLAGGLSSVDFAPDGGGPPVLRALPAGAGPVADWTLHDLFRRPDDGGAPGPAPLPGAVAVGAPGVPVRFHRIRLADLLTHRPRTSAARALAPPVDRPLGSNRPSSPRSRKDRVPMSHRVSALRGDEAPPGAVAPVTLFVIPHAGGSGAYYRRWSRWLPVGVRLEPLDLPGHATRIREPLITEWGPLADDLTDQLRVRLTGGAETCVLAGHSLGALVAYEMARRMTARGEPPGLLMVSGRNGPAVGLSHRPMHALPDARFLDALERLGGSPDGALREPDILRLYLPLLRADLKLAETYTRSPGPPLAVPIAAFAGRWDQMTDDQGLIAWNRETTESFDLTVVDGGHFFHDAPGFAAAVRGRLERLLPAPRPAAVAGGREDLHTGAVLQGTINHL